LINSKKGDEDMTHFYAEIQGNKGVASRQGSKSSGIWGHIRGWSSGVRVEGKVDQKGNDVFHVYMTCGSGGMGSDVYLGKIVNGDTITDPEFIPAGKE
jgi:hypothetical protein